MAHTHICPGRLLNAQQLVVLGEALAPRGSASLDLSNPKANSEVRDVRTLCFTTPMGNLDPPHPSDWASLHLLVR